MNGLLAVTCEPLEDGSASGIGEGLEEIVCGTSHAQTITKWLWFVKKKFCAAPGRDQSSLGFAGRPGGLNL
jgi:hypothetical protein